MPDLASVRRVIQRLQLRGWHVLHIHADWLCARGQGAMLSPATWACHVAALLVASIDVSCDGVSVYLSAQHLQLSSLA